MKSKFLKIVHTIENAILHGFFDFIEEHVNYMNTINTTKLYFSVQFLSENTYINTWIRTDAHIIFHIQSSIFISIFTYIIYNLTNSCLTTSWWWRHCFSKPVLSPMFSAGVYTELLNINNLFWNIFWSRQDQENLTIFRKIPITV